MKVNQGQKHKYLGMDLDYSTCGQCKVPMIGFVNEILTAWEKADQSLDNNGYQTIVPKHKTKSSAAPENLFVVDKDCKKLNSVKAKAFHNIVAKALYVMKQARPNASVAIAFLTTRV
jgi:hypothetical protein